MAVPTKTLNNGFEMPIYGLGTWQMGGARTPDDTEDAKYIRAIESAIEHGVKHIDTAEMYGAGHTEQIVGRGIKRFDRSDLLVVSKVSAIHAGFDDVIASCEASLRRLKTDYLDLYLMHSFAADVPLAETMDAMATLVERELVRNLGVSNFGPTNMENAKAVSSHPIVVNQVHYNLSVRQVETAALDRSCRDNDVFLMAWRPLNFDGVMKSDVVRKLSEKYGKTPNQVAINWLVSQDNVITLAKTTNDSHLEENLSALDWAMEPEDIEFLRSEYESQTAASDAVPLDS